jgi:hypothetical protein
MVLYLTLNIVLAGLMLTGTVSLAVWSAATQHRDPGCERSRLARGGSVYAAIRVATAADAEQSQPSASEAPPWIALRDPRLASSKLI